MVCGKPPICFKCKHFKQFQPLHFIEPGECQWEPSNTTPPWFDIWFGSTDQYHKPDRAIHTMQPIMQCNAFEEKVKTLGEKFHDDG